MTNDELQVEDEPRLEEVAALEDRLYRLEGHTMRSVFDCGHIVSVKRAPASSKQVLGIRLSPTLTTAP